MRGNDKFAAALFWQKTSQGWHPILPMRGLGILLGLVALVLVMAYVVDRELAELTKREVSNSFSWKDENQKISSVNYKKITNSLKSPIFRSAGYTPPKIDQKRKRILIIGDSFIWGDGFTNINTIWWRQLQWELERRGYHNVDVIAAGTNGASTQDELEWINTPGFLDETHPDAIVFGYVTNDPQIRDGDGVDKVKVLSSNDQYDYIGQKLERIFPHLGFELRSRINSKLHFEPNDTTGYPYGQWELKILEGQNFEEYKQLLKRLAAKLNQIGVPAFFVTTPNSPYRESFEIRYKPVAQAMHDAGLEFNDLLPAFLRCCEHKAVSPYEWVVNPANGHPGPRATYFYAAQVADLLETKYLSALGVRSTLPQYKPAINDWMPANLNPKVEVAGTWTFNYPGDKSELLYMPVAQEHIALNFDRPVTINKVSLHTEKAGRYIVWATVLDDNGNYEGKEYVLAGDGRGTEVKIAFARELSTKRITSLRIAANPLQETDKSGLDGVRPIAVLDKAGISKMSGSAYSYSLPGLSSVADDNDTPARSDLLLLEDGKPLAFPHAMHRNIIKDGRGSYSHWQADLLFSSSDGSDPRKNGRSYVLVKGSDWIKEKSIPMRLNIEFNSLAVRL